MNPARVFLIGGAPGAGKTTLGCALAARIGGSSVTIDDLMTVAKTATTPQSHPDLYLFRDMTHFEYFTDSSLARLKKDADRQHEAIWPFVKNLILKHFDWTTYPIVIDGWHLRPDRVSELNSDQIDGNWIYISESVLEERERSTGWFEGSSDPEQMFRNFMNRSLWYNELMRAEADRHGMRVLHQDGSADVDRLCDAILSDQGTG